MIYIVQNSSIYYFHKTNEYIKGYDGSKYLTLISSNEKDKNSIKKEKNVVKLGEVKHFIKVKNINLDD